MHYAIGITLMRYFYFGLSATNSIVPNFKSFFLGKLFYTRKDSISIWCQKRLLLFSFLFGKMDKTVNILNCDNFAFWTFTLRFRLLFWLKISLPLVSLELVLALEVLPYARFDDISLLQRLVTVQQDGS